MCSAPNKGAALDICGGKFIIPIALGQGHIPICTSGSIYTDSPDIRRIIIAIPSLNYDANFALRNVKAAMARWGHVSKHTMIVAPQFLKKGKFKPEADLDMIYWQVSPFWGSSKALTRLGQQELRLSTFEVLDALLDQLTQSGDFAHLASIVIVGHSAGGQLVNRYAASSRFQPKSQIELKYIAMNAGSYLYFDMKRPVPNKPDQLMKPSEKIIANCPRYNMYGYGLEQLYHYHQKLGLNAQKMRAQYRERRVIYAVGSRDTRRDKYIGKKCEASLQGWHRLQRARSYYDHLVDHFGNDIRKKQSLLIVPRAKHSGRQMLKSKQVMTYLFGG
jgi:hypothetical protein